MEAHALALLRDAKDWHWCEAHRKLETAGSRTEFSAVTASLLALVIEESNKVFGEDSFLCQFWKKLGECNSVLNTNVAKLQRDQQSVPPEETPKLLMQGVDRECVNFDPLFQMADEIFTHLCVAFMNPGGGKSTSGTPHSIDDMANMETDELLKVVASDEKYGVRKQEALNQLVFKRDGPTCVMTGERFKLFNALDNKFCIKPILSHVIPNSIHNKSETLKLLAMFAGQDVAKLVTEHLNTVGNAMNLEANAHLSFDSLDWGIEAKTSEDDTVTYTYRIVFSPNDHVDRSQPGPGFIRLKDGDNITFGTGPEAVELRRGPLPLLCNLHLAVARVTQMSGAADIILRLRDEADDGGCQHLHLFPEDFKNVLTARLLLVH